MSLRLEESWQQARDAMPDNAKIVEALMAAYPLAERSVPIFLKRQAEMHGDKHLFTCGEETLTYNGTEELASLWGGVLLRAGISKGDRIAILCGNRPEFMGVFLGCAWIGAIAVPINTASRGMQLQHMLENCGAKLCFLDQDHSEALQTVKLSDLRLTTVFVIGDAEAVKLNEAHVSPVPAMGEPAPAAELQPDDLLAILYTSGTTGMSKGVACPHGQFFWWSILTGSQLGIRKQDILHTTLPLFHVNALNCFFQALLFGATQIVAGRFSVTRFWDELIEHKATITYLLGAMVPMLLSREERPGESMHTVRLALAPGVPASFQQPFMDRSAIVLFDGYGSTETNAVIGCNVDNYRPDTMGTLKDGIEARVVDHFDQAVPDGQPGELLLRATEPFCFASGYFNMADKTVEAWRNLWFHTGDQVVRNGDGYFKFIDRAKDCIRRRGENISSFEVEHVLVSHPAISLAAVFAVASELGEDEVMATIILEDGNSISEEEIIRFCEKRMSYFSIPRFLHITDALPRTESGKIQKYKLRECGRTPETWDREAAGIKVHR